MDWVPDYTVRFSVYWSLLALVGVLWSAVAIGRFLSSRNVGRLIVCNFTLAYTGLGMDRSVSWYRGLTSTEPPRSFELFLVWLCAAGMLLMWADLSGKITIPPQPPTFPPCREGGL